MFLTKLDKVLLAIDFSTNSLGLLESVNDIFNKNIGTIVLAHVFEDAKEAKSAGAIWQDVLNNLSKYKKELVARGFDVKIVTPSGNPALEIVRLAETEQVDMILIASSGKGYIQSALLGSTSFDVARIASCPVFIERGRNLTLDNKVDKVNCLSKILLPTDFSAASLAALAIVRVLHESIGEIVLVHVIEKSNSLDELEKKRNIAKLRLEELVEELQTFGIKSSYMIKVEGTASRVLLQIMKEDGITMSIFPRTGAGIVKGLLIGSTAQAVLLNSETPLLMIPTPYHD